MVCEFVCECVFVCVCCVYTVCVRYLYALCVYVTSSRRPRSTASLITFSRTLGGGGGGGGGVQR